MLIAALGVAWQAWFAHVPGRRATTSSGCPGWMPMFLVGMCFAAVSANLTLRPRDHLLDRMGSDLTGCWILAVAIFAIACTPVAGPARWPCRSGWEAAAKVDALHPRGRLLRAPADVRPRARGRCRPHLSGRVALWLGDVSYGVYAIHLFVMGVLFRVLDIVPFTGHFFTILVLDAAITLAVATLSWRYFESPILRFKNVRWMMRREPARPRPTLSSRNSTGASEAALTAAIASIAHACAQYTDHDWSLIGPQVSPAVATSRASPAT